MNTVRLPLVAIFAAWFITACATVQEGRRMSANESLVAPYRERAAQLAAQAKLHEAAEAWKVALT